MNDVLTAFSAVHAESTEAIEAYAILIEMAQYVPSLFEDILRDVLTGFLARLKESALDVNSKTMTLEFLLTLVEGINEPQFECIMDCMAEFVAILMECLLQIQASVAIPRCFT